MPVRFAACCHQQLCERRQLERSALFAGHDRANGEPWPNAWRAARHALDYVDHRIHGALSMLRGSEIQSFVRQVFSRVSQDPKKFFALPNCYEVFGFDFMMDQQDKLWLLEINPDPSPTLFPTISNFESLIGGPSVLTTIPSGTFASVFCLESFHAMERLKKILS